MSNVVITGNVTADPIFSPSKDGERRGDRVFFNIAENYRVGEETRANYFPVTLFGYAAKNVAESVKKGTPVTVSGYLGNFPKDVQINGEDQTLTMISVTATNVAVSLQFGTVEYTKTAGKGGGGVDPDLVEASKPRSGGGKKKAAAKQAPEDLDEF